MNRAVHEFTPLSVHADACGWRCIDFLFSESASHPLLAGLQPGGSSSFSIYFWIIQSCLFDSHRQEPFFESKKLIALTGT